MLKEKLFCIPPQIHYPLAVVLLLFLTQPVHLLNARGKARDCYFAAFH